MTGLDPHTRDFYRRALQLMTDAGPPFLVGGAYAFECHTGISRHTKDLDLFVAPADSERVLELFRAEGLRTERTHPHWLAKIYHDDAFVDVIYRSGNGLADVDQQWLDAAVPGDVVGMPVRLCAAGEMIWSKAFIMERERFDGADVAHLILACGANLDWTRLLSRFGTHWRVLYAHLVLFGYVYPGETGRIPSHVLEELSRRFEVETSHADAAANRMCRGTVLSRSQYLKDINDWGYADARLRPMGRMTPADVAAWTEAIQGDGSL